MSRLCCYFICLYPRHVNSQTKLLRCRPSSSLEKTRFESLPLAQCSDTVPPVCALETLIKRAVYQFTGICLERLLWLCRTIQEQQEQNARQYNGVLGQAPKLQRLTKTLDFEDQPRNCVNMKQSRGIATHHHSRHAELEPRASIPIFGIKSLLFRYFVAMPREPKLEYPLDHPILTRFHSTALVAMTRSRGGVLPTGLSDGDCSLPHCKRLQMPVGRIDFTTLGCYTCGFEIADRGAARAVDHGFWVLFPHQVDRERAIEKLREKIDAVDRRIVKLMNQRAQLAIRIGEIKRKDNAPIFAPDREEKVLKRVIEHAGDNGPLSDEAVRSIYTEIISALSLIHI